jgi:hypothetical protein
MQSKPPKVYALFQELRKVKVWETEGKHFSEGMHG